MCNALAGQEIRLNTPFPCQVQGCGQGQDQLESEAPHDSRTTDSLDLGDCLLYGNVRCDSVGIKRRALSEPAMKLGDARLISIDGATC
jgi:hypothetical protein